MYRAVCVKTVSPPPVDRSAILRYAYAGGCGNELDGLLSECLAECLPQTVYRVCFAEFSIKREGDALRIGALQTTSVALSANLKGCDRAIVFAATVGIGYDRLIKRYSRVSPAKALLIQAIGTERVEAVCDELCRELAAERRIRPRFSPGYGDLPLELQRDVFAVLDCGKHLGLALNESLLITPSKTVTAIIGIQQEN